MMEVGRVCLKVTGREAGKRCVVIEAVNDSFVMVDGEVKRRKCNVSHLEPLGKMLEIGKNASHEVVVAAMKQAGLYNEKAKPARPAAAGKNEKKPEAKAEKKGNTAKEAKEKKKDKKAATK